MGPVSILRKKEMDWPIDARRYVLEYLVQTNPVTDGGWEPFWWICFLCTAAFLNFVCRCVIWLQDGALKARWLNSAKHGFLRQDPHQPFAPNCHFQAEARTAGCFWWRRKPRKQEGDPTGNKIGGNAAGRALVQLVSTAGDRSSTSPGPSEKLQECT